MLIIKTLGRNYIIKPIAIVLSKIGIKPILITMLSLLLAVVAFHFYRSGLFITGAVFLVLSGLFDVFDGEVARLSGKVTKLGGFIDSTIDRISEFFIFFGLFLFYRDNRPWVLPWIFAAFFGSIMVSYTRARGEGLGISPQVGIFERFVRFCLLTIGSLLGHYIMAYVLILLTCGTLLTMIRRIFYIQKASKGN